jgi:hypothetical protein
VKGAVDGEETDAFRGSLGARTSSGNSDSVHPVTMMVTGKIGKHRIEGKVRGGGRFHHPSSRVESAALRRY